MFYLLWRLSKSSALSHEVYYYVLVMMIEKSFVPTAIS